MPRLLCTNIAVVFVSLFTFPAYSEDDCAMRQFKEITNTIKGYVKEVCAVTPLEGQTQEKAIVAAVNANAKGLMEKFAKIDIDLKAEFEKKDWKGALQKDLVALKNIETECQKHAEDTMLKIALPLMQQFCGRSTPLASEASQASEDKKTTRIIKKKSQRAPKCDGSLDEGLDCPL